MAEVLVVIVLKEKIKRLSYRVGSVVSAGVMMSLLAGVVIVAVVTGMENLLRALSVVTIGVKSEVLSLGVSHLIKAVDGQVGVFVVEVREVFGVKTVEVATNDTLVNLEQGVHDDRV